MLIKDFLPLIIKWYPHIRLLSYYKNDALQEEYIGKAIDTPYKFLERKISSIHSAGGIFEVYLEPADMQQSIDKD